MSKTKFACLTFLLVVSAIGMSAASPDRVAAPQDPKPPSHEDYFRQLRRDCDDLKRELEAQRAQLAEVRTDFGKADEEAASRMKRRFEAMKDRAEVENLALAATVADEVAKVRQVVVPVGGVIAWWGSRGSVPHGFEICDGELPTTPGSTLGRAKPDLESRFPQGADAWDRQPGDTGGTNAHEGLSTLPHTLTIAQMPRHSHATIIRGNYGGGDSGRGSHLGITPGGAATGIRTSAEGHGHPHSHGLPELDNRPRFTQVFFIVRVK